MKKFYITTPIYYPSGEAHMGHCYSTVAADAIARYKRARGFDVMFLTGTDEHGQKIELNAQKSGLKPKVYVDEIVAKFQKLWKILGISYDRFIRTTDDYHIKSVQKIFKILYNKGEIYKGKYSGWYCIPCESFFADAKLVNGKCPDCGREVKQQEEEAYFFKLAKYSEKILEFYKKNPEFIQPESRKNEMIEFIKSGLEDLCVSRTSFKWGIPVDFDPEHVVYVWIDALTNYITVLGYDGERNSEDFDTYWPADVHFVGKEIVRFHAIIWPAILMALDIVLPKQIYGHGWILFGNGNKMSKSRGNVVDPFVLCEKYGIDAIRYFLLREIPFGSDGYFSNESLIGRINSDLANDLGNLLSRTVKLVTQVNVSDVSESVLKEIQSEKEKEIIDSALRLANEYESEMDSFRFSIALSKVWNFISLCNKYIDFKAPWKFLKIAEKQIEFYNVLYTILESLRVISILIKPIMPETAEKIQIQIGAKDVKNICAWEDSKKWGLLNKELKVVKINALFPRIDCEKELNELAKLSKSEKNDLNSANSNMNLISIDDFKKIDLVVAKILECKPVKNSNKLLELVLNDGNSNRTVVSGIADYYSPEELIDQNVILVFNLAPAKLCGIQSNGMILASTDKKDKSVKVIFVNDLSPGSKIS
ncbi:MAG: methionine--tRNA ligase [Oscillospiraceae bacterium]|jgi:methionyl-tRNA synthetase|nr:methionine--tRNA ligase [Oscillospiraceae bacterium]